jgi:hypothetical protein
MTSVLLFVPGLMGSELLDDEGTVWPGSLFKGIVGFDEVRFNRLLNLELKVGGIIERVGYIIDIYAQWMAAFSSLSRSGQLLFSRTTQPPTLYVAPYDWRIDLRGSAKTHLAPVIRRIDEDWKGKAEIHIMAHSLGGLLTRYYLQGGEFDNEPGFAAVRTFSTFGSPHNGAPVALAGALGLHAASFLSVDQSMRLANDPRYPALYQTFPPFDMPIIWKRMPGGYLEALTLADRQFATQKLKLNAQNLDAALAFREAIDLVKRPLPKAIRAFLMIGTRFDTITHFSWNGMTIDKQETREAGDGTVSIQGAFLPGVQIQFTGEAHMDLISSEDARQALQGLFDADGLLAAPALAGEERVVISIRDRVVNAQGPVQVRIHAEGDLAAFKGKLVWERATRQESKEELTEADFAQVGMTAVVPIQYAGPTAEMLMLRLFAPMMTGMYRLVLKRETGPDSFSETFIVR